MNYPSGRLWRGETIAIEKPVTYPQEWLSKTVKPLLTVGFSEKSLRELAEDCHVNYETLNILVVKAFLVKYLKERLTQEMSTP
ncbi:hypothetical protein RUM44_013706 [Polyplax serrata]|uniref:Uncharacterized protein n=1 Tax=Polyplax serrata TaxID=468196 RepID=A0ABR1BEX0_POLSC